MYELRKNSGYGEVIIINTDTNSSMSLGRVSIRIKATLVVKGIITDVTSLADEWKFELTKEVANELCRLAFRTSKEITKVNDTLRTKDIKENNKKIDAMDVLLGLANYN